MCTEFTNRSSITYTITQPVPVMQGSLLTETKN